MALERDVGLTLAGGGNRAFYQLGLLAAAGPRLFDRIGAVAASSAGACVAIVLLADRRESTWQFWQNRRAGVTKNLDWTRLLRGKSPAPHGPIYRDTLIEAVSNGGLERIRRLPFPVLVTTSTFPRPLPAALAAALGIAAYSLERKLRPDELHPSFATRLGFRAVSFDARLCETPDEIADLVIASSSTPPFTPIGNFRERRLLDGGLVDNVPAKIAESVAGVKRNLVVLTRPLGEQASLRRGGRLYLAPSRPVPVERWDYTRPELVADTIAMGERESALHAEAIADLLRPDRDASA
jgi:predicted acylesterase/phospholipase RssA